MANGLKKPAAQPPPPPDPMTIAEAVTQQHAKLVAALAAAEARVLQYEGVVSNARTALADSEATRFADGLPLGDDTPEAQGLAAAMEQAARARALVDGLHRNLSSSDVQLLSAHEALNHHRKQHAEQAVLAFVKAELAPAAQAYAQVLAKAQALDAALGIAPESRYPEDTLAYYLQNLPTFDWSKDREAKALHKEHSALRVLSAAMQGLRRDAEIRLRVSERSRSQRAGFDPTATYVIARPLTVYGKEYKPGDRVTARDIHLRLLSQIFEMGKIRMLHEGD